MQEDTILCFPYSGPSVIRAVVTRFVLSISVPYQRAEAMYFSDVMLDAWVGLQRGLIYMGL